MIKVLIADDHPIVRAGLKQVIERSPDMKVAGEALDGQQVIDRVAAEEWDVVILDFSMPGKNGLDVIREIHRQRPALPVLVLSMHPESELAPRLLKAGIAGYLKGERDSRARGRDKENTLRRTLREPRSRRKTCRRSFVQQRPAAS